MMDPKLVKWLKSLPIRAIERLRQGDAAEWLSRQEAIQVVSLTARKTVGVSAPE